MDRFSKILQEPDERLRKISQPIVEFNEAKQIGQELITLMYSLDHRYAIWFGFAAPQIGYNKRLITLHKRYHRYTVMVNPEIIKRKWLVPVPTRCFSVKKLTERYLVKYPIWMKVKYKDLEGNFHIKTMWAGRAAVMQQEIDHINGILISDIGKHLSW